MEPVLVQKKTTDVKEWKPYKSWRFPRDLLKSMSEMSQQQLLLNLIEANLVAYYNNDVLNMINARMTETSFYLRNRHVLENVINTNGREKNLNDKIKQICKNFDEIYVNGKEAKALDGAQTASSQLQQKQSTKKMIKENRLKNYKAKFLMRREDFILALSQISDKLFECTSGKTEEQVNLAKKQIFMSEIMQLNRKIQEQQEIKSTTSIDSNQSGHEQESNNGRFINFSSTRGYAFYFKNEYKQVSQIFLENSTFLNTKNRSPLKLDFGFAKFIYKNDDQLSHEIIAMQYIKYLNKIFGKQYILEYQIIPEIKGALYQFVEGALTVAHVKREHNDLVEYLKYLAERKGIALENLQRRFAESYAGYCIAEFLLQIKDRNNANIMIKDDGTFFHIDLAFIFNAKPGGISFENAPFKMTKQYVKAMGGFQSDNFKYFESVLIQLITKVYESRDEFLYKLQIVSARSKQIRCFNGFDLKKYRDIKIVKNLEKTRDFVENLIDKSFDSWCTRKYDAYQFKVNKIPV